MSGTTINGPILAKMTIKERIVYAYRRSLLSLKHANKRMYQRLAVEERKKLWANEFMPNSPYETGVVHNYMRLIKDHDSTLLACKNSGNRYLINPSAKMDAILKQNSLEVILDKTKPYYVPLSTRTYERLVRIFDSRVELLRADLDKEIHAGVNGALAEAGKFFEETQ